MRLVLCKSYDISEILTCVTGYAIESGVLVPRLAISHFDRYPLRFSEEAWIDFVKQKPLIDKYFSTKWEEMRHFPEKEGIKNPLMIYDHEIFFRTVTDWAKSIEVKSKYMWSFVEMDQTTFEKLSRFQQDITDRLQKLEKEAKSSNECMEKLTDLVCKTMSDNLNEDPKFYRNQTPRTENVCPNQLFNSRDVFAELKRIEVEEPLVDELIRIHPDHLTEEITMKIVMKTGEPEPDLTELADITTATDSEDEPY